MNEADERDALYQAIMDNWEDDTPRLVYADWLDERDDEPSRVRAELIRVQCETTRLRSTGQKVPVKTEEREQELFKQVWADLCAGGVDGYFSPPYRPRFHRGFIAPGEYDEENSRDRTTFLAVPLETWRLLGPVDEPGQMFLNFDHTLGERNTTRITREFQELANSPALRYWRSIRIGTGWRQTIGEDNFVTLINSAHLRNVRTLEVTDQTRTHYEEERCPLGNRALTALAGNPVLSRLASIKIWWSGVDDTALKVLAKSDHLRGIRHLSLADHFTEKGVGALAKSPILGSVESLHLNAPLTGRSLERLLRSPWLKNLNNLDLSGYTSGCHESDSLHYGELGRMLDSDGVRALANSAIVAQLRRLKIGGDVAAIDPLVKALEQRGVLEQLELDVAWGDEEVGALQQRLSCKVFLFGRPFRGG
ncbi:MAG: TIGR02996 domain-containing protein [Planctomycetes bacterium]|nr:TIGR02996 domain-containing protein [Planctomycetota bacterium]